MGELQRSLVVARRSSKSALLDWRFEKEGLHAVMAQGCLAHSAKSEGPPARIELRDVGIRPSGPGNNGLVVALSNDSFLEAAKRPFTALSVQQRHAEINYPQKVLRIVLTT